jgi:hypothetical protein
MSGYRSEKANEQRSDDGRSEGDSACKSGTPSHTVKGRVPMTDALIGRACSTDADLRRRALLLFALSSRSLSSYPFLACARIHPAAATWAPRPAQPPRAPALPVLRCDLEFPSDSPRRASRPSERTAAHTRPSASQAHLVAGSTRLDPAATLGRQEAAARARPTLVPRPSNSRAIRTCVVCSRRASWRPSRSSQTARSSTPSGTWRVGSSSCRCQRSRC